MVLDGVLFMGAFALGFHQGVQILADAGEVDEATAVSVPLPAQNHRFHPALRHQVVEGSALNPEQPLHIPPPPKLGQR